MAASIGKRKRQTDDNGSEDGSEDEQALRARFQKAFETKFKPLSPSEHPTQIEEPEPIEEDSESEGSEWDGLSDEDVLVQVVDHHIPRGEDQLNEKYERKSFMSSKPPSSATKSTTRLKPETPAPDEDSAEKANLKNDLALQRLLKESHLLNPSSFNGKVSAPESVSRLKSLDMRIQDLGAKKSISEQEKMPLSHRRGIAAKATDREDRRRKEAAENGVILERAKGKGRSKPTQRRERSVGGPGVGKFKGGTLKLSSKDVKSIQGPKDRGLGKRKDRR